MSKLNKKEARARRHRRLRGRISGTAEIPRMSVCRTEKHIYVQFVDDEAAKTLASYSTLCKDFPNNGKRVGVEGAKFVGKMAAEQAKANGITTIVFDRGGFRYHGKIKAVADSAREAGLKF